MVICAICDASCCNSARYAKDCILMLRRWYKLPRLLSNYQSRATLPVALDCQATNGFKTTHLHGGVLMPRYSSRWRAASPGCQENLTAFCATCPEPAAVEQCLEELGLRLDFFLPAQTTSAATVAPMPAQYHYEDEIGTRVSYLAGPDSPSLTDEDEPEARCHRRYPAHASRFWLTPGGRELVTRRVRETLAARFDLRWLALDPNDTMEGAA